MYVEEPKKSIDWGNVLKKGVLIIIIALVIFLVIWLFARNNTNGTNVNYDNGNNSNVNNLLNNTDFYTKDFIDNFRYFHDTSKEYFLISELPETGMTLKYTLQQLIDKNLILSFGYNGRTCDTEASYVTVTNTNGKYHMTTTLVCGTEVAKTTEELGCNQLCVSGNCKVNILEPENLVNEYRYKQSYLANENVYACLSGYTKIGSGKNTICVKGDETTVAATKVVSYNCPNGYYNLDGDKTTCTKDSTTTIDPTEIVEYSCKAGYTKTGEGENTKCYKKGTAIDATVKCSQGTYNKNTGKCEAATTSRVEVKSVANYGCPNGYTKYSGSGSSLKCYKKNAAYYNYYDYPHNYTYKGCTYSGSVKQSCGSNCTKTVYAYYCGATYSYKDGIVTSYSCPNGSTPSGSGSSLKCYQYTPSTISVNPTYSCAAGYQINNTDHKCYPTSDEEIAPTKSVKTNCPDGFKESNGKCVSTGTDTQNAIKNTQYNCPAGYNKIGLGPESICTKGNTTQVNPTVSSKQVTKYRYQWSQLEQLDGWERTGETRQVKASATPAK